MTTDCSYNRYDVKPSRSEKSHRQVKRFSLQISMIAKWVAEAIESAGTSQAEVARRMSAEFGMSVDRAAINKVISGKRDLSAEEMIAISSITRFPMQDFDAIPRPEVEIVGKVGASSDEILFGEGQSNLGRTRAPDGASPHTVAVEVEGVSLGDLLDGAMIFYDNVRNPPDESLIRKLCVCGLADGRVVVKSLRPGRLPGRWDLHANVGPPIYDAEVTWAAIVRMIKPPLAE